MQNQYYNPEINILLCRCRMVSVSRDWRKDNFLPDSFWRFYYHPHENVRIICESQVKLIPAGAAALIPPGTKLAHNMAQNFKQFYIHFLTAEPYRHCRPGVYLIDTDVALKTLLDELIPEAENREAYPPTCGFSIRLEALCGIALSRIPEVCLEQNNLHRAVQAAINYIDKHYRENLSNERLARVSGMATNSFIRLFHQKTGVAPQQYLKKKRIEQAAVLLRYTDKSIAEIADECGFATRYHFSRVFKQVNGYAPAEFRSFDFSSTI